LNAALGNSRATTAITDEDVDLAAALHGGQLRTKKTSKRVGPVSG
jgi:hypothetical protein